MRIGEESKCRQAAERARWQCEVLDALVAASGDIQVSDTQRLTPLHLAAIGKWLLHGGTTEPCGAGGHSEVVQRLLQAGVQVGQPSHDNDRHRTALHYACWCPPQCAAHQQTQMAQVWESRGGSEAGSCQGRCLAV